LLTFFFWKKQWDPRFTYPKSMWTKVLARHSRATAKPPALLF
jgi:hypothetical protein